MTDFASTRVAHSSVVLAWVGRSRPGAGQWRLGEDFFSSSCRVIQTLAQTFMVPALRKLREERGTRFLADANEINGRVNCSSVLFRIW